MAFIDRSKDMTLTEFIQRTTVTLLADNKYRVEFTIKDGTPIDITVNDCGSEFEANERVFLYLQEKIRTTNLE